MTDLVPLRQSRGAWIAGLVIVIAAFCAPMFFGLAQWEMRSDEAIYSYAVDRILETGEWLTPRSIPGDGPFYEKPPLKFWLVAGAMRLGLLPADDVGMRGVDALAAAAAFLYLYVIGCRLGGPVAGVTSVLALFSFDDLLHEHGLRSNNMEAVLVVAYTAAVYHAMQWADAGERRRRTHTIAIAAWFVLAFLVKFVAALFLPLVVLVTIACRPGGIRDLLRSWREWRLPVAGAVVLIAPWFIYETVHAGSGFWATLLTAHVLQRFAGVLHPEHLHPWHYYLTWLWRELGRGGLLPIYAAGLAALTWLAWRRQDWQARAVLCWWAVPFVLLSAGTSKLFHYAYPFLPPLALGVGVMAALAGGALMHPRLERALVWPGLARRGSRGETLARGLAALGVVAFALAAWAVAVGPVNIEVGGVRIFRSAVLWRPAVIGGLLWLLAGRGSRVLLPAGALLLAWFLFPVPYPSRINFLLRTDHPIRTARDCALDVARGARLSPGIYHASGDVHHAYYYYLRRVGWMPWHSAGAGELQRRLETPGQQTPVILARADYLRLGGRVPAGTPAPVALTTGAPPVDPRPALTDGLPRGVLLSDDVVLLFPQPYDACADAVARDAVAATRLAAVRPPVASTAQ